MQGKTITSGNEWDFYTLTLSVTPIKRIPKNSLPQCRRSVRATMYSEVLDLISSYENGFADFLKKKVEQNEGNPLPLSEANLLFNEFEQLTEQLYEPLKEKARVLMAARDMAFRDALHEKLKDYIDTVSPPATFLQRQD